MLVRALGLEAEIGNVASFNDIEQSDYYYESLLIAKQLGIVTGVDGSSFNPKGEISRQDMMVIVARALKLAGKLQSEGSAEDLDGFLDASSVAGYAQASVAALISEGIIQGDGSSIHPAGSATRAQAAVVIYRIYQNL